MISLRSQKPEVRSQNGLAWITGYCALPLAAIILGLAFLSSCSSIQRDPPIQVWWDMKRQLKFHTEGETGLFPDGRNTRMPPEDTVARGSLYQDTAYTTGMENGVYVGRMPVPITPALVHQGQLRFNTYCSPCHDRTGSGRGIVPAHTGIPGTPVWQPANLNDDRLVQAADGDLFNVITYGRRSMPPYRFQITVPDRWAIIAYVRVLQRASHANMEDVPAAQRADLR